MRIRIHSLARVAARLALFVPLALALACAAPGPSGQGAQATAAARPLREPDVRYEPTPQPVVREMLRLAGVGPGDLVYDLGSGDGRIPITAAREFGAQGVGIDIDPQRIRESEANARDAGVTDRVRFRNEDLFEANFREATVVTLYLLPSLNERLKPKLWKDLKPGTRIVSHAFDMGDWEPEKTVMVSGGQIFLWRVPAPKTAD